MKKEYSVFIVLTDDEMATLLHPIFKRKGWLKDVPKHTEPMPFDNGDSSFEYHWEEEITQGITNHRTRRKPHAGEFNVVRLILKDELLLAIAHEAHMMGRIYSQMGEPEKPSEVCDLINKMVEWKKEQYTSQPAAAIDRQTDGGE